MRLITHKLAVATAVAAAFSMAATPAWAGGHGHHGGHHGGHWGHHDDDWDIDGDDVLAGVLILGGLAAIAGIASSGKHREQQQTYPEPPAYPDDANYQAPPAPETRYRAGGMAEAVDACVGEIEARRGPVGSVDRASRSGEGWYVAGDLDGGVPFACWVDDSGRVTNVRSGGDGGASYDPAAEDAEPDPDTIASVSKQAAPDAAAPAGDERYELAQAEALAN